MRGYTWKNILYVLIFLSGYSSVQGCPFKVTNDGNFDLILIEHQSYPQRKYHIKPGENVEIPGAAPEKYIWVYVQDKVGIKTFELKFAIL